MVIKLKSSSKLAVALSRIVLLICSVGMVIAYPVFRGEMEYELQNGHIDFKALSSMSEGLIEGNYILYNEIYEETDRAYVLRRYGDGQFELLRKYMDYAVFDRDGEALLESSRKAVQTDLAKKSDTPYAFRVAFTFQGDGEVSDIQVSGNNLDELTQYDVEQTILNRHVSANEWSSISNPSEVQIVYGMTGKNLSSYMGVNGFIQDASVHKLMDNDMYIVFVMTFSIIAVLAAVFVTVKRNYGFGTQSIFKAPLEIVLIVYGMLMNLGILVTEVVWLTISGKLMDGPWNFLLNVSMWLLVYGIIFWGAVCLSAMFTMKRAYWSERTLCGRLIRWSKRGGNKYGKKVIVGADGLRSKMKSFCKKQYDALIHLDFRDRTNRTIFRIIIINFVVLMIICSLWFIGFLALGIYSIVLFIFLRKFLNNIQSDYRLLLRATNQLAEGDLDTPIEGDMGIFNPIEKELQKIQSGFKKAVQEEVKSERMKTELITNVSHDLKTPLTAIITYTDLLKHEAAEDKRKEYLEVLDKKSLRLKALIEDLFEISKAASKNVTMNFMDVDIVGLLKQVGLEYDSKIQETNLDFRWKLPEHKIILWLDSQKTYRIFENMIVNITKYAMPHTRVYVEMKENNRQVSISMKNISATELNFNVEEITDRFVRGDSSRNTEGSGLGLAIAKSFTELQHGTLKISTEADLYKAEITFPKRQKNIEPELDDSGNSGNTGNSGKSGGESSEKSKAGTEKGQEDDGCQYHIV